MLRMLSSFCVLFLSGCGAAYISPDVNAESEIVQVVPLTMETVSRANSSPYSPKSLPAVFFQTSGSGDSVTDAVALPEPVVENERRPIALETRIPPSRPSRPYEIGVGDVVLLATKSRNDTVSELSGLLAAQNSRQGYTVQDDGAIVIPDVGRVQIAGLTLEQSDAVLFQALVENQIDPSFSLEIAEFNSQRVSVGGAVRQPKIVPVTFTGLRLDEALVAAGGPEGGNLDFTTIRLYRDGQLYQIPLSEYLRRTDLQSLQLVSGDSLFVDTEFELERAQAYFSEQITITQARAAARQQALSELQAEVSLRRAALNEARSNFSSRAQLDAVSRDYVYLLGEVTTPGRFTLPFGRHASLADALFDNGGFNAQTGNPSEIYVLRGKQKSSEVTAWHLNASNVSNIVTTTHFEMRPNDIIFVAEQPVTRWNRVVQQLVPSLITFGIASLRAN